MNKSTRYIESALLILLVFIYGFMTYQRNLVWKDDVTLWTDNVKKAPANARAYEYLGLAYQNAGDIDRAIEEYKKSLILNPFQPDVHNNIGVSYFYNGETDAAIRHFRHALSINPSHRDAHYNLGIAYGEKGLLDLAEEEIRKGMQLPMH